MMRKMGLAPLPIEITSSEIQPTARPTAFLRDEKHDRAARCSDSAHPRCRVDDKQCSGLTAAFSVSSSAA